ncbi:4-(cytidine 5'-diphospho)-2-C-methyl-D-erythritol kinase [Alkalicoccobacillus porphyridii]|uniref:4-diphosphocytidyl-2-C-methyl-D-erythritol kinase n=1 Tax=Alkalicoccobacillus porphyridii TaxID=2597270 RepID=A0A553ZUB0_9BACI|nr:4-(cytidine 5'-diphospho)-2-C-methyl-D-erythritol kinase [Alkalicoccobacillus porphyridii]TSB45067.1 4-(cytidine 5'-diphospho)-2-C-methyl-D-erythritol kinase [Alkalicoccobacillus porphyridii]
MKCSVKAPAKINLSLDVLGKREDGYHEVEMIMTTVDLADRIDLTELPHPQITVEVSEGYVPSDHRNLAWQAGHLLQTRFGVKKGAHIYITKRIPVAAGLAGGSSDAAATLRGLNELWGLDLSLDELAKLGSEIGSDVPFCVYGGTAIATGRGEIIEHIDAPPPFWVILAKPPTGVSTADIYRGLQLDAVTHPDTPKMVEAIRAQDFKQICSQLHNVLESVTLGLYPEVANIKNQMQKFGADGVLMSGSGPTVFGLIEKESRVNQIYNGLRGFCEDVFAVRVIRSANTCLKPDKNGIL